MRNCFVSIVSTLLAFHALGVSHVMAADDAAVGGKVSQPIALSLLDVHGKSHRLGASGERKVIALLVLSTECPIANGYVPELNRLFQELRKSQPAVAFYGVVSDRFVTREEATKHSAEYKIEFPVLFDASGELAAWLQPTHTPEAFVLSAGRVAYRGRIDNAYPELGVRRQKVTQHEFADAIAAVAAGKPVAKAVTEPVGCLYEPTPPSKVPGRITYTRHIAPILQANCVTCHRTGEVAPFPLTNYEDAAKRAKQIARVTHARFMPPWKAEHGFGQFLDERRLTDRQIELVAAWAEGGAPEGDAAELPPSPKFADGWQLGEPDLILKMPEAFEIPAGGRDVFRQFVIPIDVSETKLVAAAEFRPGNRRVVHHSILYLDSTGAARLKDAADSGPGYASFGGPGIVPTGGLGGWAPGGTPRFLPDDMGRYLRKGSDLVMQIHYHPTGKVETDQSMVGLYFVKNPSQKVVGGIAILDRGLDIPPGEKRHPISGSYTLPMDLKMVGITPHMHLIGREMKVIATLPDGKVEPLIWIKDWNFNWQDQYLFAEPKRFPKGTRLDVEAYYDNSSENPAQPSSPPRRVTWGEQTTDEMFICFFNVSTDQPRDLIPLILDNVRNGHKLQRAPRASAN